MNVSSVWCGLMWSFTFSLNFSISCNSTTQPIIIIENVRINKGRFVGHYYCALKNLLLSIRDRNNGRKRNLTFPLLVFVSLFLPCLILFVSVYSFTKIRKRKELKEERSAAFISLLRSARVSDSVRSLETFEFCSWGLFSISPCWAALIFRCASFSARGWDFCSLFDILNQQRRKQNFSVKDIIWSNWDQYQSCRAQGRSRRSVRESERVCVEMTKEEKSVAKLQNAHSKITLNWNTMQKTNRKWKKHKETNRELLEMAHSPLLIINRNK